MNELKQVRDALHDWMEKFNPPYSDAHYLLCNHYATIIATLDRLISAPTPAPTEIDLEKLAKEIALQICKDDECDPDSYDEWYTSNKNLRNPIDALKILAATGRLNVFQPITEFHLDMMVKIYEEERAKYVGGVVHYKCNSEAFKGAMKKAISATKKLG